MLKYNNYYIITDTDTCGRLKEGLHYGMVIFSLFLFYLLSYQDTFTLNKIEMLTKKNIYKMSK